MWFLYGFDKNRAVQALKMARSLKFRIKVEEELYYSSSENKGADQLRSYLYIYIYIYTVLQKHYKNMAT